MADKKDDLPWGADGFRLKNVRIRPTFRRKTKKSVGIVRCDLPCDADGFRLKKKRPDLANLSPKNKKAYTIVKTALSTQFN